MSFSIVQINRNTETTCECGSRCEKISFDVVNALGDSFTYGSTCIKSVLGIDTKHLENKRGIQTLQLQITKSVPENKSYMGYFKILKIASNSDVDNILYKVFAKWVIVDQFSPNGLKELNLTHNTINYSYKQTKKGLVSDRVIQKLEIGSYITESELNALL